MHTDNYEYPFVTLHALTGNTVIREVYTARDGVKPRVMMDMDVHNGGLTVGRGAALLGTMLVLAVVPTVSSLAIAARSAAHGFRHGAAVTAGVLLGDLLFIALAIFGLAFLADRMGDLFVWIKYLGGAWLIWLGITVWRSSGAAPQRTRHTGEALAASFLLGLFITVGDQKAVLFYLGFFPAFVDLSGLTGKDAALIMGLAVVAIAAKLVYAAAGGRVRERLGGNAGRWLGRTTGTIMMAVGLYVLITA